MGHWTLRDVAEACGVSVSTASRALNNREDVNPQTRKRVLEVARQLGYVPSSLAKGLWSGKTKVIGVVVTTILNPFYANVVTGIEEVLSGAGYTIQLNSSHENPELELRAVRLLLEQRVDGIILAPVQSSPEAVEFLEKNKVPYVVVGRQVSNVQADFVVCDDELIGRLAAEHLVSRGHEKIFFVNSIENLSAELRLRGFTAVLEENGLRLDNKWVRPILPQQAVSTVLDDAFADGLDPSAIFCFCDGIAIEVLRDLNRRGIKVPHDMALLGVDNLDFVELLNPALTTIDVQQNEMGVKSAELLLTKITEPATARNEIILTPRLITRESA